MPRTEGRGGFEPGILYTGTTVTIVLEDGNFVIDKTHPNFTVIRDLFLNGEYHEIRKYVDIRRAINNYTRGNVTIENGQVLYMGRPARSNRVLERIIQTMSEGKSPDPWMFFFDKLMQNPSKRAVDELFAFISNHNLPIAPDGDFYGYKAVRRDGTDRHTGTIPNRDGAFISVPRNEVNEDWRQECSNGLHVGDWNYVRGFASGDDQIKIVKVNPRDVVSVPANEATKLRTCRYFVAAPYRGVLLPDTYYDHLEGVDSLENAS